MLSYGTVPPFQDPEIPTEQAKHDILTIGTQQRENRDLTSPSGRLVDQILATSLSWAQEMVLFSSHVTITDNHCNLYMFIQIR